MRNISHAPFTSSLPFYVCPDVQFYYIERFMCNIAAVFCSGGKMQCDYDKHQPACHLPGMFPVEKGIRAIRHLTAQIECWNNAHFYFLGEFVFLF